MLRAAAIAAILLALSPTGSAAQWRLDLEGGAVWSISNDVRIPGDSGTEFSLTGDLSTDASAYWRARVEYVLGERHVFSVLYAPLTLESTGSLDKDLDFVDETFSAGTDLTAEYMFNSYRFTYRYEFRPGEQFQFGLGLTGKVRDAKISVAGGGLYSESTNVGFVPLLNFRLSWAFSDALAVLFEGDAAAASQGRAEDVILALVWRANDRWAVRGGYRVLEGGADNDEVYNFAFLSYAALGVTYTF